jgi:hypothetical protein
MMFATGGSTLKSLLKRYFFVLGLLWLGFVPLCVPVYFSSPDLAIGIVFVIAPFGALIITLVAIVEKKIRKDRSHE